MNTSITNEWLHSEVNSSTPILKKALQITGKDEVRPRQVVRKLATISGILAVGILGLICTLIAIRLGLFHSSGQQSLAGLFVLLSVGLILVSFFGLLLAIWGAFVSTYLQSQGWKFEVAEVTDQIQIIVESVAAAAPRVAVARGDLSTETTFPVNEPLVEAVRKVVSRAAPTETAEMVSAFRDAAEGVTAVAAKVRG
ncbi:MAG: hypothetical protein ACREBG_17720 [Pyrinomonadaceae bacterium]